VNLFFRILRSVIYVPAFFYLFGWLAIRVRVFDTVIGLTLPSWTRPVGIVCMVGGGLLALSCIILFITRGKGTPAAFDPPKEFVATGPYVYVRNPMYIGGFILLAGFGLFLYSLSILIFLIIVIGCFHLFVVFYEEPVLERQFGNSYMDYKKSTRRWIPRWK
jgi:protein-S-isoprenylcysteine O-methyltransferase Ste14